MVNPFLRNPALSPYLFPPVTVEPEELTFLEEVPLRVIDDPVASFNNSAYHLKELFTEYNQTLSEWVSGTMGEYCTGGFEILYKGLAKDLPIQCLVTGNKYCYIIQLHYGKHRGPVCLQYLITS